MSEAKIWGWVYKQFPLSMLTANKYAWKKEEDLYISKRGFLNEPRNVAIYLVRKIKERYLDADMQRFFDKQVQFCEQHYWQGRRANSKEFRVEKKGERTVRLKFIK